MRQAAEAGVRPLGAEPPTVKPSPVAVTEMPSRIDPLVASVLAAAVAALIGIVLVLRRAGRGERRD